MILSAEVLVTTKLSAEEVAWLSSDFEEIGLTTEVREVSPRRSLDLAWVILAVLPWRPFVDKLVQEFASDAHERLKIVAIRIFDRWRWSPGTEQRLLVLQDTLTGVQVVLEPDLPPESYRQLLGFDFSSIQRGPLRYDQHHKQWRAELVDATTTTPPPTTP
ncbi:MAG: hypothetical protein ACRDQ4_16595 [Pseudonocardiaceae bacterium]